MVSQICSNVVVKIDNNSFKLAKKSHYSGRTWGSYVERKPDQIVSLKGKQWNKNNSGRKSNSASSWLLAMIFFFFNVAIRIEVKKQLCNHWHDLRQTAFLLKFWHFYLQDLRNTWEFTEEGYYISHLDDAAQKGLIYGQYVILHTLV